MEISRVLSRIIQICGFIDKILRGFVWIWAFQLQILAESLIGKWDFHLGEGIFLGRVKFHLLDSVVELGCGAIL